MGQVVHLGLLPRPRVDPVDSQWRLGRRLVLFVLPKSRAHSPPLDGGRLRDGPRRLLFHPIRLEALGSSLFKSDASDRVAVTEKDGGGRRGRTGGSRPAGRQQVGPVQRQLPRRRRRAAAAAGTGEAGPDCDQ